MKTSSLLAAVSLAALALSAAPARAQVEAATEGVTGAENVSLPDNQEILVTARRRQEAAQTVPVSIVALSSVSLERQNVRELQDLSRVVPGLRFDFEGAKTYSILTLRGIGQTPIGDGVPGVVSYFADVPLPFNGSNLPTFDLASIQVLKGPQGTLFGRNTLGGAVLVSPQAPTHEFGGYAAASYGRFNAYTLEGAINVPLITDKVGIRLAGQVRRQDGRTRNLNAGPDFDNVHENSLRASLLLTPFDGFKSTTIYQYFKAYEQPGGPYLWKLNPGFIPFVDPYFEVFKQQQDAAGRRAALSDLGDAAKANRKNWGISNDTSYEIGSITLRNIFGYRQTFSNTLTNAGGNGPVFLPTGPGLPDAHLTIVSALGLSDRSQLTEEFQILGDSFNNKLHWVVGAFYNNDKSIGPGGANYTAYTTVTGIDPNSYISAHVQNKNFAVYAQATLDLSDMLLPGLSVTGGLRYSWDKVNSCGGAFFGGFVSPRTCRERADLGATDGIGVVKAKGDSPSWTIGLDYKASDDVFLYLVSRRGYRGVSVNTPAFESPYTTGATVIPSAPGAPGCTGPGNVCPDLRPFQTTPEEKLTDFEVGVKTTWQNGDIRGKFNLAGYVSKYKGALAFYNVSGTGIYPLAPDYPSNQSVGLSGTDRTISGVEMDLIVSPTRSLSLSANGAYTHDKIDKVYPAAFPGFSFDESLITLPSPRWTATFGAEWTLPTRPLDGQLVLSADYFVTSKFGGQSGTNLPGYELANARLSWLSIADSNVDLGLSVRNLFNEFYFTAPLVLIPNFPGNTAYPGAPRTWTVDVKVRF